MLVQCRQSATVGRFRTGLPKSLPHKELHPKNDGGVQGAAVPHVDGGEPSHEDRRVVTKFRSDADSAVAGSTRAGGPDQERNPSMSDTTHEAQPPNPGGEELLTRKELARRLRVHVSTVDNWRDEQGLPAMVRGNRVFFDWAEVKAWLRTGPKKVRRRKKKKKGARSAGAKRKGKPGRKRSAAGKKRVESRDDAAAKERRAQG